jgi:hypothetical protein
VTRIRQYIETVGCTVCAGTGATGDLTCPACRGERIIHRLVSETLVEPESSTSATPLWPWYVCACGQWVHLGQCYLCAMSRCFSGAALGAPSGS